MAAKPKNKVALVAAGVILGVVAGAMIVKHTVGPIDPSRLRLVRGGGEGKQTAGLGAAGGDKHHVGASRGRHANFKQMVASRAALRSEEERYTVRNVVDALFKPHAKFDFKPEFVATPSLNETQGDDEHLTGWDDVDAHLWSDEPPVEDTDGDVELVDILTSKLPLFITALGLIIVVELTAVMQRRGRDLTLALSRGRPLSEAALSQIAKESQWMILRPFATGVAIFLMFCVIKAGIDVFDKCFWNWACWADLDCNLRILTPAVAECTVDVVLPATILTAIIVALLLGFIWSCTRAGAAAFLIGIGVSGLFALTSMQEYVLFLWLLLALGGTIFWFMILPTLDPATVPEWAEDLGSLSASRDARTGQLRDGDRQQPGMPLDDAPLSPSSHELSVLSWMSRVLYHIGDFLTQHARYARTVSNGVGLRLLAWCTFARRVRVHGESNVCTIASHDSVLLCSSNSGDLDLWIGLSAGLWTYSGCGFFTLFPASCEKSYESLVGAAYNLFAFGMGYFPPLLKEGKGEGGAEGVTRWNAAARRRALYELRCPGVVVALDTEGDWGEHIGELALCAEQATIVPVQIEGLSGDFWTELWHSVQWNAASDHPINVSFGPRVLLDHVRSEAATGAHGDAEWDSARELMREGVKEAKTQLLDARFGGDKLYQGQGSV